MPDDLTYRGFRISEVCGAPFAALGDDPYTALHLHPETPYGGIQGLVRAIDNHLFRQSAEQVQALLDNRREHIRNGTWDAVNSCPKGI